MLNDNGAWSWFEDERAVVDPVRGTLVVSSVADASGTGGTTRDGNVEVVVHDLATGDTRREVLHAHLQDDDHNSAALYVRRRRSATSRCTRRTPPTRSPAGGCRGSGVAAPSGDRNAHSTMASAVTYSNVYPGGDGGRLYAFVRAAGRDPHVLVSDDEGVTWRPGGRLLDGPGRPYVRYAADHTGTDPHPHDRAAPDASCRRASITASSTTAGLLRSDGTVVDADLSDDVAVRPERLTSVFAAGGGVRAWTVDLQVDADGRPYAAFSVHASRNEYWYARFDGGVWRTHFLAHAGSALYGGEAYYTGLVALDPGDPGACRGLDRRAPRNRRAADQRRRRPAAPRAVRRHHH